MSLKHLLPPVVCLAILTGCASAPPAPAPLVKPSLGTSLLEADNAAKAGHTDKALTILRGAASDYPSDKNPWLRMAQLRFDNGNYGDAIVNGLEALERDPDDTVAYSLVAVSGLRVTSKALADLTQKNNLQGNVRDEASELAKLLRTSLGEKTLVPRPAPKRSFSDTATTTIARPKASSNNPFDFANK
jgi:tetratricopeptide (TPR) repeat protein